MFIGSAQNTTLLPPAAPVPEYYEELWWWSGNVTAGINGTTAGVFFVQKGTTGTSTTIGSTVKLFTLNSNSAVSTKYALEIFISSSNAATTAYAALYDFTSSMVVSGSSVSTTSNTGVVLRSGQFALTPSHVYGVTVYISGNTSYDCYITDASLIVFPQ